MLTGICDNVEVTYSFFLLYLGLPLSFSILPHTFFLSFFLSIYLLSLYPFNLILPLSLFLYLFILLLLCHCLSLSICISVHFFPFLSSHATQSSQNTKALRQSSIALLGSCSLRVPLVNLEDSAAPAPTPIPILTLSHSVCSLQLPCERKTASGLSRE